MRDDRLTLGVDIGTTSVKVVAVDTAGRQVAEAQEPHPLHTPQPGWTEQDPEDWWTGTCRCIRKVTAQLRDRGVAAIGLSGQMHGMVPLDHEGAVIRPAILWNDQRTREAVREIDANVDRETLIERGGNPAITGFQLAKIVWLKREEPESYARLRQVLFPKDFVGFRLTGRAVSEPSDASGSNCFHLARAHWDEEVLRAVGIEPALFPALVRSQDVAGTVTKAAAEATSLPTGLPVIAGAGDNAAAATGLGISSANSTLGSLSLGTSGVLFAPIRSPSADPLGRVHLFAHADGGYYLLGVTLAAAGSLRWLRDTLFPGTDFDTITALAEKSPPGANGLTFQPYLAGERTPYMDPELRGAWHGLSLASRVEDLVRSVLEGVAFSQRDSVRVMRPLTRIDRLLAIGGGSRSPFWLQLVADVLELELNQIADSPGAAYGAALLAHQGLGQEVAPRLDPKATFRPDHEGRLEGAYARYRMLSPGPADEV